MSDFKRADGLLICSFCGAVYSPALEVCPQCKRDLVEKGEPVVIRKILCGAGYLCPMENVESLCCISCDGLLHCPEVCHLVSPLMKIDDLQRVVRWDEAGNITIYGKSFCSQAVIEGLK